MLSIKILGSGCANCQRLEQHAQKAADLLLQTRPEIELTIEKVTDPERFLDYGLLATPGLVVNEKLVSSGRVPSPSQIAEMLEHQVVSG
ncbi:MAG: thioredoxin family protein [Anaerolineales bacterium]|jgi:small redox-active disulfide protein 2